MHQHDMKTKENRAVPITFPTNLRSFQEDGGDAEVPQQIHVIPKGQWDHPAYGEINIDDAALREFKENYDRGLRRDIPITEGHDMMEESPAIGWFDDLEIRNDGLWASINWTERGKTLLAEKAYKYFSPEFFIEYEDPQTREDHEHVIVGGALTNRPYFKNLKAVVLSEDIIKLSNFTMELDKILKKAPGDLSSEEKDFIRNHESDLSDEDREKFDDILEDDSEEEESEDDQQDADESEEDADADDSDDDSEEDSEEDADADEDDGEGEEKVEISASEFHALKEKADAGYEANKKLETSEVKSMVDGMTFSESNKEGPFLSKTSEHVKDFMLSLSEKQRKEFTKIVDEIPSADIFSEKGNGHNFDDSQGAYEKMNKMAEQMADDKEMKFTDALRKVRKENSELAREADKEAGFRG